MQISKGNSIIWNEPWCPFWENIHSHLHIQNQGFTYPQTVSDLWYPQTKTWNIPLIQCLFGSQNASLVSCIPVYDYDSSDMLIWKHNPAGVCTTKSAYHNFRPALSPNVQIQNASFTGTTKNLLQVIWKNKVLPPRVQTFAWRLLRQALPTAQRAASRSSHIQPFCKRCGQLEDDIHLFFSCEFVRAVWFVSPLAIRTDYLLSTVQNLTPEVINTIFTTYQDQNSLAIIFLILWNIWKARNDIVFNNKEWTVLQVINAAKAMLNEQDLEYKSHGEKREVRESLLPGRFSLQIEMNRFKEGPNVFTDAAWRDISLSGDSIYAGLQQHAGLGIFVHLSAGGQHKAIFIAAASTASSVIQAEARALELGAQIAKALNLHRTNFLTDNQVLAEAAARRCPEDYPGHWTIRDSLSAFIKHTKEADPRVFKLSRPSNKDAHRQAQDGYNLPNSGACIFTCVGVSHDKDSCPVIQCIAHLNVQCCTLLSVTCF